MSLDHVEFTAEGIRHPEHRRHASETEFGAYLDAGAEIMEAAEVPEEHQGPLDMGEDFERLRWFPLPDELRRELLGL